MAYKVIILYRLYMPSYFLGTFTEYPFLYEHIHYKAHPLYSTKALNNTFCHHYSIQTINFLCH